MAAMLPLPQVLRPAAVQMPTRLQMPWRTRPAPAAQGCGGQTMEVVVRVWQTGWGAQECGPMRLQGLRMGLPMALSQRSKMKRWTWISWGHCHVDRGCCACHDPDHRLMAPFIRLLWGWNAFVHLHVDGNAALTLSGLSAKNIGLCFG